MTRREFQEILQDLVQDVRDIGHPVSVAAAEVTSETGDPTRAQSDRMR